VVERNPDLIVEKQGVAAVAADGASWRSGHVARIEARRLDSEAPIFSTIAYRSRPR
jgi:hypothetical protein